MTRVRGREVTRVRPRAMIRARAMERACNLTMMVSMVME